MAAVAKRGDVDTGAKINYPSLKSNSVYNSS